MAEKSGKQKKARVIKDAGQRLVFAGIPAAPEVIARMLAEAQFTDTADPEFKKAEADALRLLGDPPDDAEITIWVQVGEPVEGSLDKQASIDSVVGPERIGRFRAPTATAWRGEVRRKVPTQVPLDVELVD